MKGTESFLVGDNLTSELRAQGLQPENYKYSLEGTGDLGGLIIRDRLWFYAAGRKVKNERTPFGLWAAPGPDGSYNTSDDVPGAQESDMNNVTGKLTWQAARSYKVIGPAARHPFSSAMIRRRSKSS